MWCPSSHTHEPPSCRVAGASGHPVTAVERVIAHVGVRGLPPNYGGSEEAISALVPCFTELGFQTVVYCRSGHYPQRQAAWRGARLIYLPSPRSKNLETLVHSLLATLHAGLISRPSLLQYHGRGNAVFLPLARVLGIPAALWVDGLEWQRAKWGWFGRLFHQYVADPIAALFSKSLIADAPTIADYYGVRYRKSVACITYGARDLSSDRNPQLLTKWGLEAGRYCLFVGRLTPEKEVHTLIDAYGSVRTTWPLVIVGDNPYDARYLDQLRRMADPRVRFLGAQFGSGYAALLADAGVSVHPSRVEGTSPALITALATGCATVVSDIAENMQAAGDAPLYFSVGDTASLASGLQSLIDSSEQRAAHGKRARVWARDRYSWRAVARRLVAVYGALSPKLASIVSVGRDAPPKL